MKVTNVDKTKTKTEKQKQEVLVLHVINIILRI